MGLLAAGCCWVKTWGLFLSHTCLHRGRRLPCCCQLGAAGQDVAPWCCGYLLLLGSLADRAVNCCFFWGCALPPATFAVVGAALLPRHGAAQGPGKRLFPGEGAAGIEVWWGHLLPGGQAGVSVSAVLMGSNPECRILLPVAMVEMASLTESPVCSQWLHPRLMGDLMGVRCEAGAVG